MKQVTYESTKNKHIFVPLYSTYEIYKFIQPFYNMICL